MKTIIIKCAMAMLRLYNLIFRPLKLKDRVFITSRQSDTPSLDISMLADCLKADGISVTVLCCTLKKSPAGILSFVLYTLKQVRLIAGSKVVVIDGYCIPVSVLPKKNGQQVLQIWHSLGAIKKFGWQSVENPDGRSPEVAKAMKMHRNYDYFLAPSELTAEYFAEGFGTGIEKAVRLGLPRIDFIRKNDEEKRREIIETYPEAGKKINILYVPTFRKNAAVELEELIKIIDFSRYNFIIKKHFLDKGDYSWAEGAGAIVDDRFNSLEWMRICTKVVTDYSGISLEAVAGDKELYIYQPDADKYENNTGLNMYMGGESISEYVAYTPAEFAENLRKDYDMEKAREFRGKYLAIDLDDCTRQLAEFVKSLL